jgi:hypothetical protein
MDREEGSSYHRSAVRRFLDETEPSKGLVRGHSISEFVSQFEEFRPRFQQFLGERRSRDKREAPEFNVFEVLRVERNEAAHSRFLANLLNPAGTHGQGAFFLNHFLRHCQESFRDFPNLLDGGIPDTPFVFVKSEFHSAYGRPDIMLFSRDPRLALIIENKVYAGDQEKQLERYWNLLQNNFKFAGHRTALLNLTRGGRKPKNHRDIPKAVRYFPMGYRRNIAQWLRSCAETTPGTLRPILLQYAVMVARLPAEAEEENGEDERR